eukprot:scaffold16168_cov110-Isochrysis_galbana.AAC.5
MSRQVGGRPRAAHSSSSREQSRRHPRVKHAKHLYPCELRPQRALPRFNNRFFVPTSDQSPMQLRRGCGCAAAALYSISIYIYTRIRDYM